jgi:hypothetical protein
MNNIKPKLKYMKKLLFFAFGLLILSARAAAQGCSDAGFCSIHSIKNNTIDEHGDTSPNDFGAGYTFGKGERSVSYYTLELEYTRLISQRTSATARLGYSFISGELANTNGLTDLFLSVNHTFDNRHSWKKSFIAGLKIPFDQADITRHGIHLPMPYQTSLGTTDLVVGLSLAKKAFGATVAVQQPLKSVNGNEFLPENYPNVPLANRYLPSYHFTRKGDVLLRFSYRFEIDSRFSIRPSLLGIYHEANDAYLDANKVERSIERSSGLTANANVFANYRLDKRNELELSLATPFIVRTNRPDGLTRSFVAALNYHYRF